MNFRDVSFELNWICVEENRLDFCGEITLSLVNLKLAMAAILADININQTADVSGFLFNMLFVRRFYKYDNNFNKLWSMDVSSVRWFGE